MKSVEPLMTYINIENEIKIPLFNQVHLLYNIFGSCKTDIAFVMCACQHVLQELFYFLIACALSKN